MVRSSKAWERLVGVQREIRTDDTDMEVLCKCVIKTMGGDERAQG